MSPRSARVKSARRLTRRASRMSVRRFLAEGPQAVREALGLPGCVEEVFSTAEGELRNDDLRAAARSAGIPWHRVDHAAIGSLTDTVSPQGVVAVCGFIDVALAAILDPRPRLVAVCANMRDPGNAGSVIRSADAAGADAVILAGESVDLYNGKTVRASVGSLFHLPVVFGVSVPEAVDGLRSAGLSILAADGRGESLDDIVDAGALSTPTGWLFGNEAWGLPEADAAMADRTVAVPLYGRAESLNVATAAVICLYASARAQRAGHARES
jgi:RNA methyltransferase, TrmH family